MIRKVGAWALVVLVVLSIGASYGWRYYGAPRTLQQQLLGGIVTSWDRIPAYESQTGHWGSPPERSWTYTIDRQMCDKLRARFGCRQMPQGTFEGFRCVESGFPDWCYLYYDKREGSSGLGAALISGGKLILVRS
jgi:hypothetical protein